MKKIFYILFWPILTFGQQLNYTKTTTYKTPTTTSITSPTILEAEQNINYFDGLGRCIQKNRHQQSNTGKDIILPIEYDAAGREVKKYLPYTSSAPSTDYIPNAVNDQGNYTQYMGQNAYSEDIYEKSLLNKVITKSSPGVSWTIGSGNEKHFEYLNNTSSEKVRLFIANSTWDGTKGLYDISFLENGATFYASNTLHKKIEKNENWTSGLDNTIESFFNKEGLLVLKRMYDNSIPHDTYYVYDQFGNLTYIIPPKVEGAINSTIITNLCFEYKYDHRNRLVEKKIPGKGWQYIVYDKLNRVVMTGPTRPPFSNLSNNGWMINKYDNFDRIVITGWMTSSSLINSNIRRARQVERDNQTSNFNEIRLPSGNLTPAGTGNSSNPAHSYSNISNPTSGYYILTINYYDDYNYVDAPTIPSQIESQSVHYNNNNKPLGLLTGRWIKVLSTSTSTRKETTYTLYDYKARPIRLFIRNHENSPGGYSQMDIKFDFSGKIEKTVTLHKRINSDVGITIKNFLNYSNQGRLISHTQQINSNPLELIAENTYDELGNLISKKIGNTSAQPLQKIDYSYNIRGWLTEINKIDNLIEQSGSPNDLFAYKINYDEIQDDLNAPSFGPQYNGNISETYWISTTDGVLRKYAYKYDKLNRLKHASYRLPNSNNPGIKSFDEIVSYDKNGNIKSILRNGDVESSDFYLSIDNLTYDYEVDSNKLIRVTEYEPTATSGFTDGVNTDDDYNYDDYGNLTLDKNKGIINGTSDAIIYNHLNLPTKLILGNTGLIEYIYDADGNRIEKKVTQGTNINTTKYLAGFQYLNDVLQFFQTTEGYVAKVGSSYKYVYQYKDHLGNVRLSYAKNNSTGNIDIIEESNFYPFGLKHFGYNFGGISSSGNSEAQKYKFQEQEYQEELGLNWYSFKWRNYDPSIGRFMSIDPLAEKYNWMSAYQFSSNQVVHAREIEGLESYDDLNEDDLNFDIWKAYGTDLFDNSGNQIHEPEIALNELVITAGNNDKDVELVYIEGDYQEEEDDALIVGTGIDSDGDGYTDDFEDIIDISDNLEDYAVGPYLDALEEYTKSNASYVYKYGSAEISASQLTAANTARMTRISTIAGTTGKIVGGVGLGITYLQYNSGQITGKEATVDAIFGVIGFFGPWGAAISLTYNVVKFGYEEITNEPLFDKPE